MTKHSSCAHTFLIRVGLKLYVDACQNMQATFFARKTGERSKRDVCDNHRTVKPYDSTFGYRFRMTPNPNDLP